MNGKWEKTSDGIKVYGSGYRSGGSIAANPVEDFSDATVYIKWMVRGGDSGEYTGVGLHPGILNSSDWVDSAIYTPYTTNHSWSGSQVLPQDSWLYTRLDINPDMTWQYYTATGNYDDQNGSILFTSSLSRQDPALWHDTVESANLWIGLGDNYGGTSAWVTVAEAKYDLNAAPEPVTLLLFGTGILGLAGTRFRGKRK